MHNIKHSVQELAQKEHAELLDLIVLQYQIVEDKEHV
jgi:hypothetical protein